MYLLLIQETIINNYQDSKIVQNDRMIYYVDNLFLLCMSYHFLYHIQSKQQG